MRNVGFIAEIRTHVITRRRYTLPLRQKPSVYIYYVPTNLPPWLITEYTPFDLRHSLLNMLLFRVLYPVYGGCDSIRLKYHALRPTYFFCSFFYTWDCVTNGLCYPSDYLRKKYVPFVIGNYIIFVNWFKMHIFCYFR